MGRRSREENAVLPERCGVRLSNFAAKHRFVANALTLFRDLKRQKAPPGNRSCQGSYFCQLPGRSPGTAWTVTLGPRLLPGHQIWGLAPEFAATFWTGFSFQKIFRERLFSCIADYRRDVCRSTCECHQTSIRLGVLQIECCTPAETAAEQVPVWLLLAQLV